MHPLTRKLNSSASGIRSSVRPRKTQDGQERRRSPEEWEFSLSSYVPERFLEPVSPLPNVGLVDGGVAEHETLPVERA